MAQPRVPRCPKYFHFLDGERKVCSRTVHQRGKEVVAGPSSGSCFTRNGWWVVEGSCGVSMRWKQRFPAASVEPATGDCARVPKTVATPVRWPRQCGRGCRQRHVPGGGCLPAPGWSHSRRSTRAGADPTWEWGAQGPLPRNLRKKERRGSGRKNKYRRVPLT